MTLRNSDGSFMVWQAIVGAYCWHAPPLEIQQLVSVSGTVQTKLSASCHALPC